ncbi:phenylalanyl-tRNA synthetase, beta subunit family protein [Cryptosporidium muris RN66]|uniref:phenylalanine--tRNA ligase n=1 Tax=Cryptosporidium muris (strain RN66) TaxID=441375 RepID=B6AC30_CRYMR|nr:phenylalanyl-tRNA synthetase, beta subunit family protein [Cryptosporidium muris RN66]EEA05383.1 phenylalanyl-tRNA synthetase, beta subunit family protein [Cryptosporidium muris RN66]|eukprot:XP_002139732.1 phenylalanyl-tRNA synthetase, beta subunit family protein [Cryptosporidium muris RN66]
MPIISVSCRVLASVLGIEITEECFGDLCFQYGLEFDGFETDEETKETMIRVEIPANRPDLLCTEGLSTALLCFLGRAKVPIYTYSIDKPLTETIMKVGVNLKNIRPFILCAILRDIRFDKDSYRSFIDYQEKLHHNICRKRTLASIGTHDLGTVQGPFYYDAKKPEEINFIPLNSDEQVNGYQLIQMLKKHQQLKRYVPLVEGEELYPVVLDSRGIVMSVPPLINSEHSKITVDTRDIFIEVTAKDYSRATTVLNQIIAAFSSYCSNKFTVEPVLIEYEHDQRPFKTFECIELKNDETKYAMQTPCISTKEFECDYKKACELLGIPTMRFQDVTELLSRMMISSTLLKSTLLKCQVPINRSDILHAVDIYEDIGIAYGFNKIVPKKHSFISHNHLNLMTDQIKRELSLLGLAEALNWALCKYSDCYDSLRRIEDLSLSDLKCNEDDFYSPSYPCVKIKDAKTSEFEICRCTLIQSILKTIASHKSHQLPLKIFEVGDVVTLNNTTATGAKNRRHVCIAYSNNYGSGLEEVHGFLDQLMFRLGLVANYSLDDPNMINPNILGIYYLVEINDPTFLCNRCVNIIIQKAVLNADSTCLDEVTFQNPKICIGVMGVIHPKVLSNFHLTLPTSLAEIYIEPIMNWWPETNFYDE